MALNIKDPTAEKLAHELADATGESLTDAVIAALTSHLGHVRQRRAQRGLLAEIAEIQAFVRSEPDRDAQTADEILGYDDFGLPA
ncbi:MAG: type II toxin-antitoxin system VapB family antitoxin [Gemmatimonadaceae bacterium]